MGWFTGAAVYLIIWWLVIFMVLPWGIRPIGGEDVRRGQDAGAPRKTGLTWKVALTTLISAVLWVAVYLIIESGAISFRR